MAQLLYDRQSTDVHLNAVRRHIRLCRQIIGGEAYAVRIEPYFNALIEKQQTGEQARFDKEAAYDDVVLNDFDLDNSVRSLFEKAKQYDRENPGRPVLSLLFPDGKLSGIIYASLKDEPTVAEQVIVRLNALDAAHPLMSEKDRIQTDIDKCKAALKFYNEALNSQKIVRASEEIAQADLRRQYEFNYFDIAKEFGKQTAKKFFPNIRSTPKSTTDEESENNVPTN